LESCGAASCTLDDTQSGESAVAVVASEPVKWILGVDTSCDDTGIGLVDWESGTIGSNVVASQDAVHASFGGVVPERASRQHLAVIDDMYAKALAEAGAHPDEVVGVAATHGPGLVGALLVGLTWAKTYAWGRGLPFRSVHHLEGHIASAGPAGNGGSELCLVASGGHTSLFRLSAGGQASELGRTRDDAAGEAFDKVARLLGLPFPGGPALAKLAQRGDPDKVDLPVPLRGQSGFDFSFSGLKTAVAVHLERFPETSHADVAAAFENAVVTALVDTLTRTANAFGESRVVVVGGVAANQRLRQRLEESGLQVRLPLPGLATDNGAMIALAARHAWIEEGRGLATPDVAWRQDATPYAPFEMDAQAAS